MTAAIEFYTCVVCGKQLKGFINPAHIIRMHNMSCEEYRLLDPSAIFTKATGWNKGLTKDSSASMAKSSDSHKTPEYRERFESAMIDKYGVPYIAQDAEMKVQIVEGMRRTNLERYGVEYWGQTEEGRKTSSVTGTNSVTKFRELFQSTGCRTNAEIMFREMHPSFTCNGRIYTGSRVGVLGEACWYSPDFIDEERKIIYEIDGSIHSREDLKEKDAVKTAFYISIGYEVVRITNEEVELIHRDWLNLIAPQTSDSNRIAFFNAQN